MARLYFTGGSNGPSGGGRVLNDVVRLAREKGHEAWLCLPKQHSAEASFVQNPAPVLALEDLPTLIGSNDSLIVGWHTQLDYDLLRNSIARNKVFWQHGTLIPIGPGLVGEKIFEPGLLTDYWNVSKACGEFVKAKYGLAGFKLIPPFFEAHGSPASKPLSWRDRDGILVQQRRGFEHLPGIQRVAKKNNMKVTVLAAPFHNTELLDHLNTHKFFVSFDRGLRYRPSIRDRLSSLKKSVTQGGITPRAALFPKPKWVEHEINLLGFPISAAQAARQECVVIGFAMGGGLEWMSPETVYLAEDASGRDLYRQLNTALTDSEGQLLEKRESALKVVSTFSPDSTWDKISHALDLS